MHGNNEGKVMLTEQSLSECNCKAGNAFSCGFQVTENIRKRNHQLNETIV